MADNPYEQGAEIDNQFGWETEDEESEDGDVDTVKVLGPADKLRILTDPTLTAKEALILSEQPLPQMAREERKELEIEAGRELTNYQAHAYRMRKVRQQAVNDLLEGQ